MAGATPNRRPSRILAMQALAEWEVQGVESDDSLMDLFRACDGEPAASAYATTLVRAFWGDRKRIDELIAKSTAHWEFARLSSVDRNVMRVAVAELYHTDVPPKVAVNEAIEIAREFGGEDSPRFVNGVLDQILAGITREST